MSGDAGAKHQKLYSINKSTVFWDITPYSLVEMNVSKERPASFIRSRKKQAASTATYSLFSI
jgi:hypothetical protein